jgi:hypothetical protein
VHKEELGPDHPALTPHLNRHGEAEVVRSIRSISAPVRAGWLPACATSCQGLSTDLIDDSDPDNTRSGKTVSEGGAATDLRIPPLPVRRPKNLLDGRTALSVTTLLREKLRSTGCTVAEPDSSVGAPALARGKDHAGASLRMTAILMCSVFPDSV